MVCNSHGSLQVAGGIDFVARTIDAFSVPTVQANIIMDMHGYDGCAAMSSVEAMHMPSFDLSYTPGYGFKRPLTRFILFDAILWQEARPKTNKYKQEECDILHLEV